MRNTLLCGFAVLALAVTSAQAADMPAKAPSAITPVSVFTWTGLYVGGHVGGISGEFKSNVPIGIPGPLDSGGSAIGGGQIGYNWQFNPNWVLGIEWDISAIDVSASTPPLSFEEKWMSTLRGRIGYAWDRYLLYFTGGVGWTHVKATSATGTASNTPAGAALGGGLEVALPWPQWTARGEFLYVNVPLDSYQAGVTRIDGGSDNYIGRFGLNYRF
jgi:outer membrane immunogenic protein